MPSITMTTTRFRPFHRLVKLVFQTTTNSVLTRFITIRIKKNQALMSKSNLYINIYTLNFLLLFDFFKGIFFFCYCWFNIKTIPSVLRTKMVVRVLLIFIFYLIHQQQQQQQQKTKYLKLT